MNGLLGNAPQPVMYVRALYDYEADDRTSLSFHEGDEIQVITQLESGWWDGVINGVRGWFPSNYCQVITTPEASKPADTGEPWPRPGSRGIVDDVDSESGDSTGSIDIADPYPVPSTQRTGQQKSVDFWVPQATPDGRLYYYNTKTHESSIELPLESPSSSTEDGPRDRMNINVPDKSRPPNDLMARGFVDTDDEESDGNTASENEGERLMMASTSSEVYFSLTTVCLN